MERPNVEWLACALTLLFVLGPLGGAVAGPADLLNGPPGDTAIEAPRTADAAVPTATLEEPLAEGATRPDLVIPTSLPYVVFEEAPAAAAAGSAKGRARSMVLLEPAHQAKTASNLMDVLGLAEAGAFDASGRLQVIIQADPLARTLLQTTALVEPVHELDRVGMLVGKMRYDDLPAVLAVPGVHHIEHDAALGLHLAESVPLIRADDVHTRTNTTGHAIDGKDVIIAILDTGVDYNHSHLGGCFGPGCKVAAGYDHVDGDADPMDVFGHGTHVAATAAGTNGVAPGATIWAHRVCSAEGSCPSSVVVAALQSLLGSDADVVSMSFGDPSGCTTCAVAVAARDLVDDGKIVVASAGNSGPDFRTISSPAAHPAVIAVGATDDDDAVASFSSRGTVGLDGIIKPDLMAPGVNITAAVPAGLCAMCSPTGFRTVSGTSMAAPHVSGAAALLVQEHPGWDAAAIRAALVNHAIRLPEVPVIAGTGRLDAWNAANAEVGIDGHNLNFGHAAEGTGTTTFQRTVTLRNLRDAPVQVTLATTPLPWSVTVQPALLDLPASGTAEVWLNTTGNVSDLVPGWNHGVLTATTATSVAHATYSVRRSPILHIDTHGGDLLAIFDHDRSMPTTVTGETQGPISITWYPGRFSFPVYYANATQRSFVFVENVTVESQAWVNTTHSDAVHRVKMRVETPDGQWHDDALTSVPCGSVSGTCGLDQQLRLTRGRATIAFGFSLGVNGKALYTSGMSDIWTLGVAQVLRSDIWGVGLWTNGTFGMDSSLTFEHARGAAVQDVLEYRLPPDTSVGSRVVRCGTAALSSSDPKILEIVPNQREAFHLDIPDIPIPSFVQTIAPCPTISVDTVTQPPSFALQCTFFPSPCYGARSHAFGEVDGAFVQTRGGYYPAADVDVHQDGARPVVDGAPAYAASITRTSSITIRDAGVHGFLQHWPAASGGQAFGAAGNGRYKIAADGETVQYGAIPINGQIVRAVDAASQVLYRADAQGSLLDGAVCTASFRAITNSSATAGLPRLAWARVGGDLGLGSRFTDAENLSVRFHLATPDGEPLQRLEVRLLRGLDLLATFTGIQHTDGIYTIDLPELGPGAYRLHFLAATADGASIELRQEPAYIVGDGGCGVMPPVARASVSGPLVVGEEIVFDAADSYDAAGQALTYSWTTSSGTQSGQSITMMPTNGGKHCADLTITDSEGATDNDRVCAMLDGPVAIATAAPEEVAPDTTVTFDGSASYDPSGAAIASYVWSLGGVNVSTAPVYQTTFPTGGTTCLRLAVTDTDGVTSRTDACVYVFLPPEAVATVDRPVSRIEEPVLFDGSGSTAGDAAIDGYEWRLDGTTVATDPTYMTSFSEPGSYCLELRVRDERGLTDDATVCVVVDTRPTAAAIADRAVAKVNDPVDFDGSASTSLEPGPLTFQWRYAGADIGNDATLSHAFDVAGEQCVQLTVTDTLGQSDQADACVLVVLPLNVQAWSTQVTYRPHEQAEVRALVRDPQTLLPIQGARVTVDVLYDPGDPILAALLDRTGCARAWQAEATTNSRGQIAVHVPNLAARCDVAGVPLEGPTLLPGAAYHVDVVATWDIYSGEDSFTYGVRP